MAFCTIAALLVSFVQQQGHSQLPSQLASDPIFTVTRTASEPASGSVSEDSLELNLSSAEFGRPTLDLPLISLDLPLISPWRYDDPSWCLALLAVAVAGTLAQYGMVLTIGLDGAT